MSIDKEDARVLRIKVLGMSCGHCAETVKKTLESMRGVVNAEVDLASCLVTINVESAFDSSRIREALREIGFNME